MELQITHTTTYRYAGPASQSHNELRLAPLTDTHQECIDSSITVTPAAKMFHFQSPGGRVDHFDLHVPHSELVIRADARVRTLLDDPFENMNLIADDWEEVTESFRAENCDWLIETPRVNYRDPALRTGIEELLIAAKRAAEYPSIASTLIALINIIHDRFPYSPGATHVHTALADLFHGVRAGVCQDHAHIMLAVCRSAGIPCRYVSGYLYTSHGLVSGDQMHAWVECLIPSNEHLRDQPRGDEGGSPAGWVWRGFDATNRIVAGKSFVKCHIGRDYTDAVPTKGIYTGYATTGLLVDVHVRQLVNGIPVEVDAPMLSLR